MIDRLECDCIHVVVALNQVVLSCHFVAFALDSVVPFRLLAVPNDRLSVVLGYCLVVLALYEVVLIPSPFVAFLRLVEAVRLVILARPSKLQPNHVYFRPVRFEKHKDVFCILVVSSLPDNHCMLPIEIHTLVDG
jgi:hypothetical protein